MKKEVLDIRNWQEQINIRQKALEKERDELDSVISEMEGLLEKTNEAIECLEAARDALSELV